MIFPFKQSTETPPLGRLKSLGISSDYLAPFLFPRKYNDVRRENIIRDFNKLAKLLDEKVYLGCQLHGKPVVHYDPSDKKKAARTQFTIKDKQNVTVSVCVFGLSKEWVERLTNNNYFCLRGDVTVYNGFIQLKNAEWIDMHWVGRIQPTYPSKMKVITPETVLERMTELVDDHIPKSIAFLRKKFQITNPQEEKDLIASLGGSHETLFSVIKSIHAPKDLEEGDQAQQLLKRLAAKDIVESLGKSVQIIRKESSLPITHPLVKGLIAEMKMTLTRDQLVAIGEIMTDLRSTTPMKRLLTGDVGTGKSIPIAIAAAVCARLGENAIILMPNEPLAEQMRRDIEAWWPDTKPMLVAGSTKGMPDSRILVGTTALNFRIPQDYPLKLLLVDEQQKMSVAQRTSLANEDTNILEASATPLPRSLALIKFGGLPISTLREAYVKKDITTRMVFNDPRQKTDLFRAVKQVILDGYQALIIYPLAELAEMDGEPITEDSKKADLKTAEGAFAVWERHFPGRVSFAHGGMKSADKLNNINALNNNEADILCSTTVVEVGLNVPRLRCVVIVHPERLGLSTLHQIRGRLCRHGGIGQCALYFPDKVSVKAMKRLKIFESTTDGFKIALEDMRLRGVGDINTSSENEQSGDIDISFLPSQKVSIEDFEWATQQSIQQETTNGMR